jgi:hypothetical protein
LPVSTSKRYAPGGKPFKTKNSFRISRDADAQPLQINHRHETDLLRYCRSQRREKLAPSSDAKDIHLASRASSGKNLHSLVDYSSEVALK